MTDFSGPRVSMDSEGLHVVSEEVAEKLARKNISPSLVSSLEQCPAKWLGESFVVRELVEEEPDNAARRGTLFHKVMEVFFALPPEERTKTKIKDIVEEVFAEDEFKDLSELPEVVTWLRDAINGYYSMKAQPEKVQVATIPDEKGEQVSGLEVFVKGKIGDTKRETLGFIDRLVKDTRPGVPEGSVVVEDWKGLALDTLIPTPNGFTTMEKIKVGDYALSSLGAPTKVMKKSQVHNRPCYEISLSSKETVVCDNEHLWAVVYRMKSSSKFVEETLTADELYELFNDSDLVKIHISNPEALNLPEVDLPIDPYILGAWLGDGHNRGGYISCGGSDRDAMEKILSGLWPTVKWHQDSRNSNGDFSFPAQKGKNLSALLKDEGLLYNKHIPEKYLFASHEQRLALLQGLMDTDGTWSKSRNRAVFGGINKQLVADVRQLVASFGVNASWNEIYKTLPWKDNETYGPIYTMEFATFSFNPFRLPRKRMLAETYDDTLKTKRQSSLRYIEAVTPIPSVPTQCIGVDSEDSLYQFGKLFTLTHNTGAKVKRWNPKTKGDEGRGEARQQVIYKELLQQRGINVTGARLIFPVAREVVNINLNDEKFLNQCVTDIEEADAKLDIFIERNTFEYKPSFLCSWCSLAKICPAAQIKPYKKMQDAYAKQPGPEVLLGDGGFELN